MEDVPIDFIERRSTRIEFRERLRNADDRLIYTTEIDLITGQEKPVDGLGAAFATLEAARAAYQAHTGPKIVLSARR